ncbi:MAG: hypothetical protein ACJ0DG_11295 [bacterium]
MKKGISIDGSLVKKLRNGNKWTQKELGSTIMEKNGLKEISFRTIQRLETEADYGCSQTIINALAKVFNIDPKLLLKPKSKKIETTKTEVPHGKPPEKLIKSISEAKTTDEIPRSGFSDLWEGTVEQLGDTWKEYFGYFKNEYATLKFELEEQQIIYIEKRLPSQKTKYLRDLKFQPMVFENIIARTKKSINKDDFELFCRAYYNYHTVISGYSLKVMPNFDSWRNKAYALGSFETEWVEDEGEVLEDSGIWAGFRFYDIPRNESFLESLSKAHRYSIEYDIPDEDDSETAEKMIKFIEMIEKYFDGALSQSEEFRLKFELLKIVKSFQDSTLKILYNDYVLEDNEFESESFNLRILIKKTSDRNFVKKDEFLDKDYSEFSSTFKHHRYRHAGAEGSLWK